MELCTAWNVQSTNNLVILSYFRILAYSLSLSLGNWVYLWHKGMILCSAQWRLSASCGRLATYLVVLSSWGGHRVDRGFGPQTAHGCRMVDRRRLSIAFPAADITSHHSSGAGRCVNHGRRRCHGDGVRCHGDGWRHLQVSVVGWAGDADD